MGSGHERSNAAWAGAAVLVVALTGTAWIGRANRAAPADDGPTGLDPQEAVDSYLRLAQGTDRNLGSDPPLVLPASLPARWQFFQMATRSSRDTESFSLDFIKRSETVAAKVVSLCVSLDTACSRRDAPPGHARTLDVPGFAGEAILFGDPDELAAWQAVSWTTDLGTVEW